MTIQAKRLTKIVKNFDFNYDKDAVNTIVSSWEDIFTPSTAAADKCTVSECKYYKGLCTAKDPVSLVKPKFEFTLKLDIAGIQN